MRTGLLSHQALKPSAVLPGQGSGTPLSQQALGSGKVLATTTGNSPQTVGLDFTRQGRSVTTLGTYDSNDSVLVAVVGQRMDLGVKPVPDTAQIDHIQWTIGGHAIADYAPTTARGDVTPLPAPLTGPRADFFWPFAGDHQVTVSARVDGRPVTAHLTCRVIRPTIRYSALTIVRPVHGVNLSPDYPGDYVALYNPNGQRTKAGCFTEARVKAPAYQFGSASFSLGGTLALIQVTSFERQSRIHDNNQISTERAGSRAPNTNPWDPGNILLDVSQDPDILYGDEESLDADREQYIADTDSPAVPVEDIMTVLTLNDQFRTYLMYRPEPPSIWVPLLRFDWSWDASITRANPDDNSTPWSSFTAITSPVGGAVGVPATDFPLWTRNAPQERTTPGGAFEWK